ncbi:hypothetical protein T439DRAFT_185575 [Meredithblackwellia eburnea MCA 4105]
MASTTTSEAAMETSFSTMMESSTSEVSMMDSTTLESSMMAEPTTTSMMEESSSMTDVSTTSSPSYEATSTAAASYASTTGQVQYGSGSTNWGNSYDSCIQQCQAQYGGMTGSSSTAYKTVSSATAESTAASSSVAAASASDNTTVLVAGPGEVIVAPKKGDLRMVPFAINAKAGDTITFKWGAGPHTVTQSSALTICNKTLESGAFISGLQNASFEFPVEVAQDTQPTFYYCSVPNHCQKGMFGVINPSQALSAGSSFGSYMVTLAAKDPIFAQMMNDTTTLAGDNKAAANWGSMFDVAMLPEWALAPAMFNVLATRQFYAANPSALAVESSGNSGTTSSNGYSSATYTGATAESAVSTGSSTMTTQESPAAPRASLSILAVVFTAIFSLSL